MLLAQASSLGVPVLAIAAAVALVVIAILVKFMYRVAEPNEALIVTGMGAKSKVEGVESTLNFKIVTGRGVFVLPLLQTVRSLDLSQRRVSLEIDCVTKQAIPVRVRGVVIFKVGDDPVSIANAARRFLGKAETEMDTQVQEMAIGQLRAIVGALTVEALITDRQSLASATVDASAKEIQQFGLTVDSFNIQEISDGVIGDQRSTYITDLGRPEAAAVASKARIANADRDQEATKREQETAALIAEAKRDSEIKQAEAKAQTDQAQANASQAGPLAEATAKQQVIEAETRAAELAAELKERQLQSELIKVADAQAYEIEKLAGARKAQAIAEAEAEAEATRVKGTAEAEATKLTGTAEAEAIKAKGLAEAEGIKARREALETGSEAVINQQIAENLPEMVKAAAAQYSNVDQLVVLNGAEGLSQGIAATVASVGSILPTAKSLFGGNGNNGHQEANRDNSEKPRELPEFPADADV